MEELRQQVRLHPQAPATALKLAEAQQTIPSAAQVVGVDETASMAMVVVRQLAATAVEEYGAAIAGDQVVEAIENQDARGFLREAQRLLVKALASQSSSAQQLTVLHQKITAMLAAFPTAIPPRQVLMSVAQLQQLQEGL
jgi:hypothetical protein